MILPKERKIFLYSVGSIGLGSIIICTILIGNMFVTNCYPDEYESDGLIGLLAIFLLIGGILLRIKNSYHRIFMRIFSGGLLIDSLMKILFFTDEIFLFGIILELLTSFIFFIISLDKDLDFNKIRNQFN